ncbi:MAG: hypothetical protein KJ795_02340 [Gammaproteobacteria bacterium]|nr:hypothetical protein [Gammaproteobacteria bacterium]MBU1775556.1 hypothetical protein [Gammaproteobacteria bacterium]MBU1967606.1 hypothetical protein [Gammaproteobacteria bacterium]
MKKQIISIAPVQTGKVFGVFYFLISLPFLVAMAFFAFAKGSGGSIAPMLLLPIFYAIFGFIFTMIAAWAYNLVAGWVGGIEYTSTAIDED